MTRQVNVPSVNVRPLLSDAENAAGHSVSTTFDNTTGKSAKSGEPLCNRPSKNSPTFWSRVKCVATKNVPPSSSNIPRNWMRDAADASKSLTALQNAKLPTGDVIKANVWPKKMTPGPTCTRLISVCLRVSVFPHVKKHTNNLYKFLTSRPLSRTCHWILSDTDLRFIVGSSQLTHSTSVAIHILETCRTLLLDIILLFLICLLSFLVDVATLERTEIKAIQFELLGLVNIVTIGAGVRRHIVNKGTRTVRSFLLCFLGGATWDSWTRTTDYIRLILCNSGSNECQSQHAQIGHLVSGTRRLRPVATNSPWCK